MNATTIDDPMIRTEEGWHPDLMDHIINYMKRTLRFISILLSLSITKDISDSPANFYQKKETPEDCA